MYQLPIWAKKPSKCQPNEWYIEEIKNGTVVSKHVLNLPVTTFGRTPLQLLPTPSNEPKIDYKSVITAHESCSRLHARIAFDSTGTPWLRDMGSGNGTTINKKKLPPQSIGKLEANTPATMKKQGSRGVIIYPGDVIQFGASTRIYVLNGPSYFDRGAMKARKQMMLLQKNGVNLNANTTSTTNNTMMKRGGSDSNNDNDEGVSWGMDFDYHEAEKEDESNVTKSTNLSERQTNIQINLDDPSTIPDKYRKLYDKLQSKKYKLQNIQNEMRRIHAKAVTVELSSGQQSQLERNEKQEQLLEQEIQRIMNELQTKLNNRSARMTDPNGTDSHKRRKLNAEEEVDNDDDDVDDFYDRTSKRSNSNSADNESETMESLTSKWNLLVSKLQSQQHFLTRAQRKVSEIEKEIQDVKASDGDDDCFFLRNDLEIANDQYKKIEKDQKQMVQDLASTEKMILIIDAKMVFDLEFNFIGRQSELDALREEKNRVKTKNDMSMMPPPSLPAKRKDESSSCQQRSAQNELMAPPPPMMKSSSADKTKRQVQGPIMMPPPPKPPKINNDKESGTKDSNPILPNAGSTMSKPAPKRKRQGPMRPPVVGTLQALQQSSMNPGSTNKGKSTSHANGSTNYTPRTKNNTDDLNPKVDQWVAPKGQDGSGRTKLNAKFQGRY